MLRLYNDSYYLFFQNMSQINGFNGFVGYLIRELSFTEINTYCLSNTLSVSSLLSTQNQTNFTSDFMIRSYTSGCYYYNSDTGKWSSNGMEIYEDSCIQQTHCTSNHLTSFAGGLVVIPSTINFQYVFANASFTQNLTIYLTIIVFLFLYILFAAMSMFLDLIDNEKLKITPLKDNNPNDVYFYELIVFTGNRSESGTHSKVICWKIIFRHF